MLNKAEVREFEILRQAGAKTLQSVSLRSLCRGRAFVAGTSIGQHCPCCMLEALQARQGAAMVPVQTWAACWELLAQHSGAMLAAVDNLLDAGFS